MAAGCPARSSFDCLAKARPCMIALNRSVCLALVHQQDKTKKRAPPVKTAAAPSPASAINKHEQNKHESGERPGDDEQPLHV